MSADTQYAYAVGRIRAIERKMLDKSGFDRMVEAMSVEDALRIIIEAGYSNLEGDAFDALNYEKIIKTEEKRVYDFLREISPQPEMLDVFLIRNDYHNIKVIIKSNFLGQRAEELLVQNGTIPVDRLKKMLTDRKFNGMASIMSNAVNESIDIFNRSSDPQMIDLVLDKACFMQMREMAAGRGNDFIVKLVCILIDIANIRFFLRVKKLKKSMDFLRKFLVPGGLLDEGLFTENLEGPLDSFANSLSYKPYGVLNEGIDSFKNSGSITKFEKLSDNYIISFARKALYKPFGIEPLVGYLFGKEYEIKNVRIVIVGKLNKMPGDMIKERLRDTYV